MGDAVHRFSTDSPARAYWRHLCDSHTDNAPRLAVAGLLLALADPLLTGVVATGWPALFTRLADVDPQVRRAVVGLAFALPYLLGCVGVDLRRGLLR